MTRDGRDDELDVFEHNAAAWDRFITEGDPLTFPVTGEEVERARRGDFEVFLTPARAVPADWLGDVRGVAILCLAGGGGQQAPLFAAAGARVTVLDASPLQLDQDRAVADRESLSIRTERGSMTDLSRFPDESFDLVFHPLSNFNVPGVRDIWREAWRVLRPGGRLLSGFMNPTYYLFEPDGEGAGDLTVRHRLPFSDVKDLPPALLQEKIDARRPLQFSHTLSDQLAGQTDAGFHLTGFYEDALPEEPLSAHLPPCLATRAEKPKAGPRS